MEYIGETKDTALLDANIPMKNEYSLDEMESDVDDEVSLESSTNSYDPVDVKVEIEIGETMLLDPNISVKQENSSKGVDFDVKKKSLPELKVVLENMNFDNVTLYKGINSHSQINSDQDWNKNECSAGVNGAEFGNYYDTDSDQSLETIVIDHNLKKHKCKHCDYVSNRSVRLKAHIKAVHLKLTDQECDHCDYRTSRPDNLKAHIKTVHLKVKEHKCKHCNYSSSRPGNLERHITAIHLKLKENKCKHCHYRSNHPSDLKTHIKAVHLNLKAHKCKHCDYTSNRSHTLIRHINAIHRKLKEHQCDYCDYKSSRASSLKTHIKAIHLEFKKFKGTSSPEKHMYSFRSSSKKQK